MEQKNETVRTRSIQIEEGRIATEPWQAPVAGVVVVVNAFSRCALRCVAFDDPSFVNSMIDLLD